MARRRTCTVLAAAGLMAVAAMGGCAGTKIRGVVLAGPIGRAMVVDARDERLATQGVTGVTVKAVRPGRETTGGVAPLAVATTDEAGRFELSIAQKDKVQGPLVITAESPGAYRTSTTVYPPREGQEVLVQVRERRDASAGVDGP